MPACGIVSAPTDWMLTACCVSEAFAYDFHLLTASLQEASFHGVKGYLLKGGKPYLVGRNAIV